MPRFELSRLDSYDDASLINELRRVATPVKAPILTQSVFDRYTKASTSIIRRRFSGRAQALLRVGLPDHAPSWIRAGAYEAKLGIWPNALKRLLSA